MAHQRRNEVLPFHLMFPAPFYVTVLNSVDPFNDPFPPVASLKSCIELAVRGKWVNCSCWYVLKSEPVFSLVKLTCLSFPWVTKPLLTSLDFMSYWTSVRCWIVSFKITSVFVSGPSACSGWVVEKAGRAGEESSRARSSRERVTVPRSRRRSVSPSVTHLNHSHASTSKSEFWVPLRAGLATALI